MSICAAAYVARMHNHELADVRLHENIINMPLGPELIEQIYIDAVQV